MYVTSNGFEKIRLHWCRPRWFDVTDGCFVCDCITTELDFDSDIFDIFVYTLKFYRSERHLNVSGETVFLSYLRFVHRNNTSERIDLGMVSALFSHMKYEMNTKTHGHFECTNFSVKHKISYTLSVPSYPAAFEANGWTRKDHCQWVQWTAMCVFASDFWTM